MCYYLLLMTTPEQWLQWWKHRILQVDNNYDLHLINVTTASGKNVVTVIHFIDSSDSTIAGDVLSEGYILFLHLVQSATYFNVGKLKILIEAAFLLVIYSIQERSHILNLLIKP